MGLSERESVVVASRILTVFIFEVHVCIQIAQSAHFVMVLAVTELHEVVGQERGASSEKSLRNLLLIPGPKAGMH